MTKSKTNKVSEKSSSKTAKGDIPKTVKRYVEEHKEQGMDESKAYAIAWSRYCRYKYPNSPHCKKDPDEYFEGRDSSQKMKIASKVASKMAEERSNITIDPKEQRGLELAQEYSRELAEEEREIFLRFQYNEQGTPQVMIEDTKYPGDDEFSITQIPQNFASFARTVDYWFANPGGAADTDIERHITEMEGKEYKEAALRVASKYITTKYSK